MTISRFSFGKMATMTAVMVALFASSIACGAKSPTAPEPTPVVVTPVVIIASTANLSAQAKAYLLTGTMSSDIIRRFAYGDITVARGVFARVDVETALAVWSWMPGIRLVVVDGQIGMIPLQNIAPNTTVVGACGTGGPLGSPQFIGGDVRLGFGITKGCDGGLRLTIAHEVGHVLGFLHTSEGIMKALTSSFDIPSDLKEAGTFIYTSPIAATVK